MDNYVVFTDSKFEPLAELSISNRIFEEASEAEICDIIQQFLIKINLSGRFYKHDINLAKHNIKLTSSCGFGSQCHQKECNVRLIVGMYKKKYVVDKAASHSEP